MNDCLKCGGNYAHFCRSCLNKELKSLREELDEAKEEVKRLRQILFAKGWEGQTCTCHERDSSYVCDYCKSQGYKGHMEE